MSWISECTLNQCCHAIANVDWAYDISAPVSGLPQSILMNGQGYYGDCQLNKAGGATLLPCNVTTVSVSPDESQQQPWASASNPGDLCHAVSAPVPCWPSLGEILDSSVCRMLDPDGMQAGVGERDCHPCQGLSIT